MSKLIVLCPNPYRDCGLELTRKARKLLTDNGYDVSVCPVFGSDDSSAIPKDIEITQWTEATGKASMFMVIGGDGTILHTARYLNHSDTPMLGINLGTKGFMASLEPEDLDMILDAAAGNYHESRRMMIDVKLLRGGKVVYSDCGLNDVVIHGMGDCIKITACCDGDRIMSFSGDGIVVATPTGSTGYSMSAGGPIVEPDAQNIIISPICPHAIGARSFVLGGNRLVKVTAGHLRGRRAYLSVDGKWAADLAGGDVLEVSRAEHETLMVDLELKSFFEAAYEKLS